MTERDKFEAFYSDVKDRMVRAGFGNEEIEQRKVTAWLIWQAALASQQPADDGWIEWAGGECPVDNLRHVEVKLRDGFINSTSLAGELGWGWCLDEEWAESDIIAYRVVKP